jgi:hypothetical protein
VGTGLSQTGVSTDASHAALGGRLGMRKVCVRVRVRVRVRV